ncbi:TIGR03545 family protein [Stieleria sp. TO1_6]|uniref:TIGR03545 family protein n=1 Tax=Stieleria tagensis TaxID=2956795 RepID=UPI00209B247B|nr:TIGR03545 family protein [Stieleria tagensis]MCO8122721.1 TIGR03545 family protein [Stieleria tagensis]
MIRWRFVVTRLLIVLSVVLLLSLGLGPVVSYLTVAGLQSATGAKVEIGSADVGLFPPRVRYERFSVADPRDSKEMRDAFRAEVIELELDGQALMSRRWVAREASITGLQIGATRDESGHLDKPQAEEEVSSLSDQPSVIGEMLGGIAGRMQEQAEQTAGDLETVRRSKQIKEYWESEYDRLAKRAKVLEQNVRQFKQNTRDIDNPLRDWDKIGNTVGLADETRVELKTILAAIDAIPGRFEADLASLKQAKQIDLDRIDQYVPGNLAESKNFGIDLISEAVRDQIASIKEYWEGGRTIANYTIVAPETERARGIEIDLLGDRRQPSLLVKRCELQGVMRVDGNAYSLSGVVENLTPSPKLLPQPLRAQLRLEGPQVVNVDYIRDRRLSNDIDRLTLHWPQSDAPQLRLGSDSSTMVSVTGGKREVWVQMRSEGDQIQGRFVSKQTGVRIGLDVDSKYDSLPATTALQQSLAAVDTVTIDAGFEGTWDQMAMQMDTNLGKILRDAVDQAVSQQVDAAKQQLTARVQQAYADEGAKLNQWFKLKQIDAQSMTAQVDGMIDDLGKKLLDGVDSSDATIGRINDILRSRLR